MITIKNLYLKYIREYYALFDINLKIEENEKISFVGSEDSGKTSLIRILSKLENFTSGEVYVNQTPLKKVNFKSDLSVGYLPVNPIFLKKKTVEQNLKYILKSRKIDKSKAEMLINEVLIDYNIEKYKFSKIEELSLFEKYVISLARLSLRKLDIILIDNVFDYLNEKESEEIVSILKEKFISNENLTSIVATSSEQIANELSSRKVYFKSGSLVQSLEDNAQE